MVTSMFAKAALLVRCLAAFLVCSISFSVEAQTFEENKEMAEQGNVRAQFVIGGKYLRGEGVVQDYKQAFKWCMKAAEQGIHLAQYSLGSMHGNGIGVVQDYVRGYMWFNLAAANGYEDGWEARDSISKVMTSDQIAEAQRMVSEMLEANPKLMGD